MRHIILVSKKDNTKEIGPYMVWSDARVRFEVYRGFNIRSRLKRGGFRFDEEFKCWWTASSMVADKEKDIISRSEFERGRSVNITEVENE